MLINILGGDGGGKTTQVARLIRWVRERHDLPVDSVAKRDIFDTATYPECDFFGVPYEHVAHRCLPNMRGTARAFWLYYMNAVLASEIEQRRDVVVFHDGYWHKHYATEAAMGLDPDWLLAMGSALPEPDLTIVFDIDPREIVRRGHVHKPYESGCDFACSDASFIAQQDKVRFHLMRLARERGYRVVDAAQDEDALFATLCTIIAPLLETMVVRRGSGVVA